MPPVKAKGLVSVLLHDSLIQDVLYQQDSAFIKAVNAALMPAGEQVMKLEINQQPPEGPWMRRLQEGHMIHLCKEQAWARVLFPWQPTEPGHTAGRLAMSRLVYEGDSLYRGETQVWYVGERGQGFDGKQLILPAKGHLAESEVEVITKLELEFRHKLKEYDSRFTAIKLSLDQVGQFHGDLRTIVADVVGRVSLAEMRMEALLARIVSLEQGLKLLTKTERKFLETKQRAAKHVGRRKIRKRSSGGRAGTLGGQVD